MIGQPYIDQSEEETQPAVDTFKIPEMLPNISRRISPSSSPKFEMALINLQEVGSSSSRQERYPTPPKESPDRSFGTSPHFPQISPPSPKKSDKTTLRVRWDVSVVDNENKKRTLRTKTERESWIEDYRSESARNRPVEVDDNFERTKQQRRKELDEWIRDYRPNYRKAPLPTEEDDFDPADFSPVGSRAPIEAKTLVSSAAAPPPGKSILKPTAVAYTPRSTEKRFTLGQITEANTGMKRAAIHPASTPARFFTKKRSPTKSRVLPAAPDPPEMSRPPQAPRISRLPTPDLPDIEGEEFCNCGNCQRTSKEKMLSQLKAAEAYMKSRRK